MRRLVAFALGQELLDLVEPRRHRLRGRAEIRPTAIPAEHLRALELPTKPHRSASAPRRREPAKPGTHISGRHRSIHGQRDSSGSARFGAALARFGGAARASEAVDLRLELPTPLDDEEAAVFRGAAGDQLVVTGSDATISTDGERVDGMKGGQRSWRSQDVRDGQESVASRVAARRGAEATHSVPPRFRVAASGFIELAVERPSDHGAMYARGRASLRVKTERKGQQDVLYRSVWMQQ
jgi:hypothetical protein